MVISSLVIDTFSEETDAVAKKLAEIPGVEIHEKVDHKLVITIESETVDSSADVANSFSKITGILNTNLVYVNFEDDPSLYPEGIIEE